MRQRPGAAGASQAQAAASTARVVNKAARTAGATTDCFAGLFRSSAAGILEPSSISSDCWCVTSRRACALPSCATALELLQLFDQARQRLFSGGGRENRIPQRGEDVPLSSDAGVLTTSTVVQLLQVAETRTPVGARAMRTTSRARPTARPAVAGCGAACRERSYRARRRRRLHARPSAAALGGEQLGREIPRLASGVLVEASTCSPPLVDLHELPRRVEPCAPQPDGCREQHCGSLYGSRCPAARAFSRISWTFIIPRPELYRIPGDAASCRQ